MGRAGDDGGEGEQSVVVFQGDQVLRSIMVEVEAGQPPAVAGHEKSGCGWRGGGESVFSAEEDSAHAAAPETGFRFAGVEVLGQA